MAPRFIIMAAKIRRKSSNLLQGKKNELMQMLKGNATFFKTYFIYARLKTPVKEKLTLL